MLAGVKPPPPWASPQPLAPVAVPVPWSQLVNGTNFRLGLQLSLGPGMLVHGLQLSLGPGMLVHAAPPWVGEVAVSAAAETLDPPFGWKPMARRWS